MNLSILLPPAFLACAITAIAQEIPAHFEPLRPLIGRTWRGEFKESTPEKPVIDVSRWELALGGKVVRVLHSVNDGAYGGETIITWDESKKSLVFHYFTTAGFHTTGVIAAENGAIVSRETVVGNANGITEVRATYRFTADGRLESTASYLKKGEWVGGREVTYVESPEARVILP
jgi:hypothetical protein